MTILPEILGLVEQLNNELDRVEQQANQGLAIASQLLECFPNNARLIGLSMPKGLSCRSQMIKVFHWFFSLYLVIFWGFGVLVTDSTRAGDRTPMLIRWHKLAIAACQMLGFDQIDSVNSP